MAIDAIAGAVAGTPLVRPTSAGPASSGASFLDTLGQLVQSVDTNTQEANAKIAGMLDKTTDVHDAMIALQRAEMSLHLTVQVRNKLVSAYQDIMRMPI